MLDTAQQIDVAGMTARLRGINERIEAACRKAGRPRSSVTLVAVSKTFSVQAVRAAHALGLQHFGENRVQELALKAKKEPGLVGGGALRWHMIGRLQRNKAKDVVRYADVFHALDSLGLAETLDRRLETAGRVLPCFIQVNVSGEATKAGVAPHATHRLLDQLAPFQNLRIVGLMTMATPVSNPEAVRPQFRLLRTLLETYDAAPYRDDPPAFLSMGMSGDFEVAIGEGATHIRVGSALFGDRL